MSTKNKQGICAYCGKHKKVTADHVPPKLLLERPLPPNVWTVPACTDCNQSFMADDEYTRTILVMDYRAGDNRARRFNIPVVARALGSPKSQKFTKYVAGQARVMDVLAPDGSPIMDVQPEHDRIYATGRHILRWLYYLARKKPLQENAQITIKTVMGLTAEHAIVKAFEAICLKRPDRVGGTLGTAFTYAAAFAEGNSVWLMQIYDYFCWTAIVDE